MSPLRIAVRAAPPSCPARRSRGVIVLRVAVISSRAMRSARSHRHQPRIGGGQRNALKAFVASVDRSWPVHALDLPAATWWPSRRRRRERHRGARARCRDRSRPPHSSRAGTRARVKSDKAATERASPAPHGAYKPGDEPYFRSVTAAAGIGVPFYLDLVLPAARFRAGRSLRRRRWADTPPMTGLVKRARHDARSRSSRRRSTCSRPAASRRCHRAAWPRRQSSASARSTAGGSKEQVSRRSCSRTTTAYG